MPTQRTKQIVIDYTPYTMIRLAARGMHLANNDSDHSGRCDAYGGFYTALQNIMRVLCYADPDFMELWESNLVQSGLDLSNWNEYPEQIKYVLEQNGVSVIIYI